VPVGRAGRLLDLGVRLQVARERRHVEVDALGHLHQSAAIVRHEKLHVGGSAFGQGGRRLRLQAAEKSIANRRYVAASEKPAGLIVQVVAAVVVALADDGVAAVELEADVIRRRIQVVVPRRAKAEGPADGRCQRRRQLHDELDANQIVDVVG
jgi:hypothetical protein